MGMNAFYTRSRAAATLLALLLFIAAGPLFAESGWVTPSSADGEEGVWGYPTLALDGSEGTYASDMSNRAGDGAWLVLTLAQPIRSDRIRITADFGYGIVDSVALEVRSNGSWAPVYQGAISDATSSEISFPPCIVDAYRFRNHFIGGGYYFWLYETSIYRAPESITDPIVVTSGATSITASTATLRGRISDDGGSPCQIRFQYGESSSYEYATEWSGSFASNSQASFVLGPERELRTGVTYHFRVQARNATGTIISGDDATFSLQEHDGTPDWMSPISVSDTDQRWENGVSAIDGDLATSARCAHRIYDQELWSSFLVFSFPAVQANQLRFSAAKNGYIDLVHIDVLRNGGWTNAYFGPFDDARYNQVRFETGSIAQVRIRFHVTSPYVGLYWSLNELGLRINEPQIPNQSLTSPVFIEGVHDRPDAATPPAITASGTFGEVSADFLSPKRFYVNYPLNANGPQLVTLNDGASGMFDSNTVAWQHTHLSQTQALTIRTGDSLLFEADAVCQWYVLSSCGTDRRSEALTPGDLRTHQFSTAGNYQIVTTADGSGEMARIDVAVVGVAFPAHIADEVGYARPLVVEVAAPNGAVSFRGNEILDVAVWGVTEGQVTLGIRPTSRGAPIITARLNDDQGPIITTKEVEEFTIESSALASTVVSAETLVGRSVLVIRPFVEDEWFFFSMFGHTATFRGGTKSFSINTSQPESSNGEPGFQSEFDPAANENIGVFTFDLEVPLEEDLYCYTLHGEQIDSTAVQNTETITVNGHVCHVRAFKSLMFTHDKPEAENETVEQNAEQWVSRQWSLFTQSFCHDGNCPVSYRLVVDPPALACASVDDPTPALFGATRNFSDCKPCDGSCGPVTPYMDTGTTSGHYRTSVAVCGSDVAGRTATASGGEFWISKLDAHGVKSDARNDRFPDLAEMLERRPGTTALPVIRINFGGDAAPAGCSLYGWTGEPTCPPMNRWSFSAVATDAATGENIPDSYFIKWDLGVDYAVIEEKDGQPVTVEVVYPIGRWFPRLEVWKHVPDEEDMFIGAAEIHSIAVEGQPASNVPLKNSDVASDIAHGTRFQVSNDDAGLAVDARIGIAGHLPDGPRGRISLDGYPQNEYWCKDDDGVDLPQVVQVPDCGPQAYFLQGYVTTSESRDDLVLVVEGQALREQCIECNGLMASPVMPEWQETDRENFSSFELQIVTRSDSDGSVHRVDDVTTKSRPRPVVQLSIDDAYADSSGALQVILHGSVTDQLANLIGEPIGEVSFFVNGDPFGSATPGGSEAGDPVWDPVRFTGNFSKQLSIPDAGNHTFIITAEAVNRNSEHGRAEVGIATQLVPVDRSLPALDSINPTPQTLGLTIAFESLPTEAQVDDMRLYFGNRLPQEGDGSASETSASSWEFTGFLAVETESGQLPMSVRLTQPVGIDDAVVDQFSARIEIASGIPYATSATFVETAADSRIFIEVGGFIQGGVFGDTNDPHTTQLHTLTVRTIADGGQTKPGWIEPIVARLKGPLQDNELSITVGGQEYQTKKVTFADGEYFAASEAGRAKVFVSATNFSIGGSGENFGAEATPDDGAPAEEDVETFDDGPEDPELDITPIAKTTTKEKLLEVYETLYGEEGQVLLQNFFLKGSEFATGNQLVVEHLFFRNYDLSGGSDDNFILYITNDVDPITAANSLWTGLHDALPYMRTKMDLDSEVSYKLLLEAHEGVSRTAAATTLPVIKAYIQGLTLVNEGANLAMAIDELSQGDLTAALGVLPFVPAAATKNIKVLAKAGGKVLFEMTPALRAAIREMNKLETFAERWRQLLTVVEEKAARLLVKGGAVFGPLTRSQLRKAMLAIGRPPARLVRAVAHHDFPWKFKDWFARHGIDCNEPRFGRWVEGKKGAPHNRWSTDFNNEWQRFIGQESDLEQYTTQQVIDKMMSMRNSGRYPSW